MFEGFFRFVSGILAWFYSIIPNDGVAIILLTVTVMIVLTPLTLKSTKSMLSMQRAQPQMKKLQEQYKGDRERLNQEMMAFYKANDINPLSGCVPLIAQAPVFIILFQVLHGITRREGGPGSGAGHVVGQLQSGAGFTRWRLIDQAFNPNHLAEGTTYYKSLINRSTMKFLGVDLSITPSQALSISIAVAIPFFILMALMLVTQIYQNRQIQGRTTGAQVNPQQQAIMKFLPFMLPIFSFGFPAGLSLYYLTQGLMRIGTQGYITRKYYGDDAPGPIESTATEVKSTGSKTAKGVVSPSDTSRSSDPGKASDPAKEAGKSKQPGKGDRSSGTGKSGTGKSGTGKSGTASKNGSNGSSGTNGTASGAKNPGSSPKSQAIQRKTDDGGATPGRKSGEPRRRDPR